MAYPVAARGKAPLDVEVGTAYPAGAALDASFPGNGDPAQLVPVDVGGTEVKAGLLVASLPTDGAVEDPDMGLLGDAKAVEE